MTFANSPPIAAPSPAARKSPPRAATLGGIAKAGVRVGRTYAGKIVTVHVEDTHFRVTCDGTELSLHRTGQSPVTRWKAKIHAPKTESLSSNS